MFSGVNFTVQFIARFIYGFFFLKKIDVRRLMVNDYKLKNEVERMSKIGSDKKGQSLSLNTIIVAALALIVLVVLVVIFTGRIGIFEKGVSKEGQSEIIKMRISYGDCRPTVTAENQFGTDFGAADSLEAKDGVTTAFNEVIQNCKGNTDKAVCESAGCKWG